MAASANWVVTEACVCCSFRLEAETRCPVTALFQCDFALGSCVCLVSCACRPWDTGTFWEVVILGSSDSHGLPQIRASGKVSGASNSALSLVITHSIKCFAIIKVVSSKGISLYIAHMWYHLFRSSSPVTPGKIARPPQCERKSIRENTRSRSLQYASQLRIRGKQPFLDGGKRPSQAV